MFSVEKKEGLLSGIHLGLGFLPASKSDNVQELRDFTPKHKWERIPERILQIQKEWLNDDHVPYLE